MLDQYIAVVGPHLRRQLSTNPTRAYCNVCGLTIVSALNKGRKQCWPNMGPVSQKLCQTLEQHRVGT